MWEGQGIEVAPLRCDAPYQRGVPTKWYGMVWLGIVWYGMVYKIRLILFHRLQCSIFHEVPKSHNVCRT